MAPTQLPDATDRQSVDVENLTINPGDRIDPDRSLKEKQEQYAVNRRDLLGDRIRIPTYFVVNYPDGEREVLHHVRDAEEIADVIRRARVDANGDRVWW